MTRPSSRSPAFLIPALALAFGACADPEPDGSAVPAGVGKPVKRVDSDCDGVPDAVELDHGQDPRDPDTGKLDPDGDGVPTDDEVAYGGDPYDPDTDHDGVADELDLVAERDLDGDGVVGRLDRCPRVVDDQADGDGDGIGDACDGAWRVLFEARRWTDGERALLPDVAPPRARQTSDLIGIAPDGVAFRLLDDPAEGVALVELYHPELRDHAYVTSAKEEELLVAAGYKRTGVLGGVGPSPLSPRSRPLHRFVLDTKARHDEAVTIDESTAKALRDAGYEERTALGWVEPHAGRVRKPIEVIRFRKVGDTPTFHTVLSGRELVLGDYDTERARFRVWPDRTGSLVALRRLRLANDELLVASAKEATALRGKGWVDEGVVGWVAPLKGATDVEGAREEPLATSARIEARSGGAAGAERAREIDTAEPLVRLVRLVGPDGRHITVVQPEVAELVAKGFAVEQKVARVVALATRGPQCVAPTAVERLEAQLRAIPDPMQRAFATMAGIVTQCSVHQAARGSRATPLEIQAGAYWDTFDREMRQATIEMTYAWFQLQGPVRQELLGSLAHLDPGYCTTPLDLAAIEDAAGRAMLIAVGDQPPALREAHCIGDAADPASVTVGDRDGGGEIFTPPNDGRPALVGVIGSSDVRGHPSLAKWLRQHPGAPVPTAGVPAMLENDPTRDDDDAPIPCAPDATCDATQGLLCHPGGGPGQCFAHPILRAGATHVFVGWNFWDTAEGVLRFDPSRPGGQPLRTELRPEPPIVPGEDDLGHPTCELPIAGNGRYDRIVVSDEIGLNPNEGSYQLEFVNRNGNYRLRGESRLTHAQAGQGRTIHVCAPDDPRCVPVGVVTGACELEPVGCGGAVGGTWTTPPRPLAACLDGSCSETPVELRSRGTDVVFVEAAAPAYEVTVALHGAVCNDWTNWEWGEDELRVRVAMVGGAVVPDEAVRGEYTHSFHEGEADLHRSATLAHARATANGPLVAMILVEEDDWGGSKRDIKKELEHSAGAASAVFLFTKFVVGLGWVGAGTAGAIGAAAVWAYTYFGVDDLIGARLVGLTPQDVLDRAAVTHGAPLDPVSGLVTLDQDDLVTARTSVSPHPVVDGTLRDASELVACTVDPDCAAAEHCELGACVPDDWTDPTGGAGFVERVSFDGDNSEYDLYLGWTARPVP